MYNEMFGSTIAKFLLLFLLVSGACQRRTNLDPEIKDSKEVKEEQEERFGKVRVSNEERVHVYPTKRRTHRDHGKRHRCRGRCSRD